jgi:hypothetical protein
MGPALTDTDRIFDFEKLPDNVVYLCAAESYTRRVQNAIPVEKKSISIYGNFSLVKKFIRRKMSHATYDLPSI